MNSLTGSLAAAAFLLLLSCAAQKPSAPATSAPQAALPLAPALTAGSTWANKVDVEQRIAQRVGGRDIETRLSFSTTYRFTLLSREPDGDLRMEAAYERLAIRASSPTGDWSFDSAANPAGPVGTAGKGPRLDALRALVGGRFAFVLGTDMAVRGITGLAELAARMAAASGNPALASVAGSWMGEAPVRMGLEAVFGLFPRKKVALGESWTLAPVPVGGIPITVRSRITATKVSGDKLSARVEGIIEPAGDRADEGLRGTQTGAVELDTASLRITGGTMGQDIVGSVMVGGTKVPMTVSGTTRFESAD